MKLLKLVAGAVLLAVAAPVFASVPNLMNFQGVLKDGSGNPVANGSYTVTFNIYPTPTGGTVLWTEAQSVITTAGLFAVILGSTNPVPDSVFKDTTRYLGVAVSPDPEMLPRQRLVTVGYSFRVNSVDGASGGTITSKVSIGPLHTNTGTNAFVAGEENAASGNWSVVGGGKENTASQSSATVSGGDNNTASGQWTVVGGGNSNTASQTGSTISGGLHNKANDLSTVGGGTFDTASGIQSTVGGGYYNVASGNNATVGGGGHNRARGVLSVVAGGGGNPADSNSASGANSTIGGGRQNLAIGNYATVAGGIDNGATFLDAAVGGGESNGATGQGSTVGGGILDSATATSATVGGGFGNWATGQYASITGGSQNRSSAYIANVGGGGSNIASDTGAAVSGGFSDTASGDYATVPGGYGNKASARYALAAGRTAKAIHDGSFVWGDSTAATVSSTAPNQFVVRAGNGLVLPTNATSAKPVSIGELYRDNGLVAWGKVVGGSGAITDDYGVVSVVRTGVGTYAITLSAVTAGGGASMIPVVTALAPGGTIRIANASITGASTFSVFVYTTGPALVDNDFVFTVTGR